MSLGIIIILGLTLFGSFLLGCLVTYVGVGSVDPVKVVGHFIDGHVFDLFVVIVELVAVCLRHSVVKPSLLLGHGRIRLLPFHLQSKFN